MDRKFLDLYSDYLISSFEKVTSTGLSELLEGELSHDQITSRLRQCTGGSVESWQLVKPTIRKYESEEGVLIFDDTLEPKPYSDENSIVGWYFDHSHNRSIKGINILNCIYHNQDISLPVAYEIVHKSKEVTDPKTGKVKLVSEESKNEMMRKMLHVCCQIGQMTQNASRIYNELIKFGSQYSDWSDVRHLRVMVWMMVGIIATGSVNLTKWLSHINTKALIAQSTQRQLSRWLNNPRINPAKLYSPVIKELIAKWKEPEIYLSFDTSQLWEEYCIIRLCIVHRGRALPLCWRIIKHRSSSVEMSNYQDMLKRASKLLPVNVKVILLADRGFANPELVRYVRELKRLSSKMCKV